MTNQTEIKTLKKTARTAGLWYLAHTVFSVFGLLYVPSKIIVSGDATATAGNIIGSESLFRAGIFAILIGQIIFIPVALELYDLFKNVNRKHARMLVALVITAVAIMFLITLNQVGALILLKGSGYLSAFKPDQLNALSRFFLDMYSQGEIIIGFFWGLWLLPFGYLAYRSGFIPKIFGILVIINCIAYVFDSTVFLLSPSSYDTVKSFTTILESIGEPLMLLWLVVFGVKKPKASSGG